MTDHLTPRSITVLHVRDPDGACTVRLFLDGVELSYDHFDVVDVDAGRGYTAEDWEESIAWAQTMPDTALKAAVLEAYGDPPGDEYIVGWAERQENRT